MTYDDDSEWRRDDRPSWRREALQSGDAARAAAARPALAPSPSRTFRADATRSEALRVDAARGTPARAYAPRPASVPHAAVTHQEAAPLDDIASMVDHIITQLDAVERTRRTDAAPRPIERRPERAPARPVPADGPAPAAGRPFTEALRQSQREKTRSEAHPTDRGEQPPAQNFGRTEARPGARQPERPPAPIADDIDRHFRSLAERVDALRQRTDDRIAAVRDDVARLSEAVLARPVASLADDDRAALDALASRLDRADAFGPETLDRLDAMQDHLAALHEAVAARPLASLDARDRAALDDLVVRVERASRAGPLALDRLDAVQGDLTALGRAVVDLDLDRRIYAIEAGQDAMLERLGDVAAPARADPGIDALRRRIDWIAERLESAPAPAPDAVAALDTRLARLAGDVRRLADAPARTGADNGLGRDVAAMRAELSELTRGGIVAQFDEIGSSLARLAGEVKTAARSAGAETMPVVADLVRRIEKLDRRLDGLSVGDREDRLHGIERAVAALDRRLAEARPPAPRAAPADVSGAVEPRPRADTALPVRAVAAPTATAQAPLPLAITEEPETAAETAPPTRTSRLIAAARRAVEHPILRRGHETPGDATPAALPGAAAGPIPPADAAVAARSSAARSLDARSSATRSSDTRPSDLPVVELARRRAQAPEPEFHTADTTAPFDTEAASGPAGLGARRLLLLAAAVVGLIGGAYGFASEPLRALILTLSGSETTSTLAGGVPTLLDPHTTGSIARAPDTTPPASAFSVARAPAPGAAILPATLPATLGSPGLREAAAGGDPRAALEVAIALLDGTGVTRDPAAAVPWLTLAADSGLAPAEFRLGTLYERGIGVARSRDTAKAWYDRAAGRGHVKAMHNLAVLLSEAGEGRDLVRAVGWFEKAARHGLVDSQFNLAVLYVRGLGVAADPAAAYRWFALAARQGDQEAAVRRDEVGKELAPADRGAADLAIAGWTPLPSDTLANDGPPLPQQWTGVSAAATRS
jgi:localization factor PodJL